MRVVVVSAWEPWRRPDAAALILREQLPRLGTRHQITLLAAGAPVAVGEVPQAAGAELPGVDVRWYGSNRPATADYLARRLRGWGRGEPVHVGYVERPALLAELDRLVATGPDLVHLHGWGTAQLWRHTAGLPTLHVAVDPWQVNLTNRRLPASRRLLEPERAALVARHERRHYPRVGAVVVVAPHDADEVRRTAPGARVEVVTNGVDPGPAPRPLPDQPVLGFHGAFESEANVLAARHLVERILPAVRQRHPTATVLLAGHAPPREVQALAGPQVRVHADVPQIRTALDAMTVHVDWMTTGAGVKNKVLEALAAGRPVVASPLGAAGVAGGPGVTVATDPAAAAAAVVALLDDLPAATAAGLAGRQRVATDFTWDANAARIEALWSELRGTRLHPSRPHGGNRT